MHAGILGIHQRSPLGVVLVVSLVAVLAAGTLMAVGLTELLGLEGEGVSGALPFLQSVF